MEEREIVDVVTMEEADGIDESPCTSDGCDDSADKEATVTFEDEGDKRFFVWLCDDCMADYTKAHDRAKIFGDSAL